jgi:hypothetical protein
VIAAGAALVTGFDQALGQVQWGKPDGSATPDLTGHRRKAKGREAKDQEEKAGWAESGHGYNGSGMDPHW